MKKIDPAELFKKASEYIFDSVGQYFKGEINFSDVKYDSGYFCFEFGENTVVQYHINECPGWLFGTWFSINDDKKVCCEWFAQYEDTIDKFKPTASAIHDTLEIPITELNSKPDDCSALYISKDIQFIKEHTALAYYRDNYFADLNREYISESYAIDIMESDNHRRKRRKEIQADYERECVNFVNNMVIAHMSGSYIVDHGENCSPRYQIRMPLSMTTLKKPGTYSLEEDGEHDLSDALYKIYDTYQQKMEYVGGFLSMAFHDCVTVYDDKKEKNNDPE